MSKLRFNDRNTTMLRRSDGERHYDTEVVGLYIKIQASGAKGYYVRYRDEFGRERNKKLADFGSISVADARRKARLIFADPSSHFSLKQSLEGKSLADQLDYFRTTHAAAKQLSEAYVAEQVSRFRRYVPRHIQRMLVIEFGRAEYDRIMQPLTAEPSLYNKLRALLSTLMAIAIQRGFITSSPIHQTPQLRTQPAERFLTREEWERLGPVLHRRNDQASHCIRLMLLTGARRGEWLNAKWQDLDLESGHWWLPATRSKSRRLRKTKLSERSILLLKAIRSTHPDCTFVFENRRTKRPISTIKTAWATIKKEAGIVGRLRLHDLRHTVGSDLAAAGFNETDIAHMLDHAQTSTTQRYIHAHDERRRKMSEALRYD